MTVCYINVVNIIREKFKERYVSENMKYAFGKMYSKKKNNDDKHDDVNK